MKWLAVAMAAFAVGFEWSALELALQPAARTLNVSPAVI